MNVETRAIGWDELNNGAWPPSRGVVDVSRAEEEFLLPAGWLDTELPDFFSTYQMAPPAPASIDDGVLRHLRMVVSGPYARHDMSQHVRAFLKLIQNAKVPLPPGLGAKFEEVVKENDALVALLRWNVAALVQG
jgi:hypothetical protein